MLLRVIAHKYTVSVVFLFHISQLSDAFLIATWPLEIKLQSNVLIWDVPVQRTDTCVGYCISLVINRAWVIHALWNKWPNELTLLALLKLHSWMFSTVTSSALHLRTDWMYPCGIGNSACASILVFILYWTLLILDRCHHCHLSVEILFSHISKYGINLFYLCAFVQGFMVTSRCLGGKGNATCLYL